MTGRPSGDISADTRILYDLKGVNVAYQNFVALNEISMRIDEGEKVALVGPSGAGKTTLLNRLYQLRAGETAFIHQQFALVPQLSVFHNVYIGRLDRHRFLFNVLNLVRPQRRILGEIYPVLDELGMRDKAFVRVGELSGGQQQRVAVGRAMYRGSRILLADEPVSSLDVHQGEAIVNLIMETGKTVITSLHSVDFALRFAQRIIGLCGGRIRFDLPVEQVTGRMLDELYRTC